MTLHKTRLYVGDTHNYEKTLEILHENLQRIPKDLLPISYIHVGDSGLLSPKVLKPFLNDSGSNLFVVRGNHDASYLFQGKEMVENVYLVKDYEVIDDILFIGGAVSVDREVRLERGLFYDPMEGVRFQSDQFLEDLSTKYKIKTVVSHNSPRSFFPVTSSFNGRQVSRERVYLQNLLEVVSLHNPILSWYYGHFHKSTIGRWKKCSWRCLSVEEIYLPYP